MTGRKGTGLIRRRAASSSGESSDDDMDHRILAGSVGKGGQRARMSQSQNNAGNAAPVGLKPVRAELNEDDRRRLVADATFYILVQEQKKALHKKGDILKAIGLTGRNKELQDSIMQRTCEKLEKVFGIELRDLEDIGKKGQYLLVNKLFQTKDQKHIEISAREKAHIGALYSILGLIYMSNGTVRDEVLDPFLVKMGLMGDPEHLPPTHVYQARGAGAQPRNSATALGIQDDIFDTFGDIKELLRKEWGQKQHYIDVTKVDSATEGDAMENTYEYSWGIRYAIQ